jgi:hypothetical protein
MSMAVDSNDLQSALAEKDLAISISPEKGRCLIAKRSFTRGEIVLLQDPYVSVLDSASVNKRCDVCFRLCTNLKRCSVAKQLGIAVVRAREMDGGYISMSARQLLVSRRRNNKHLHLHCN